MLSNNPNEREQSLQRDLRHLFRVQCAAVGEGFVGRHSLRYARCLAGAVDVCVSAAHVHRRLLRLQEAGRFSFILSLYLLTSHLLQPFARPVRTNQIPRQVPEQTVCLLFQRSFTLQCTLRCTHARCRRCSWAACCRSAVSSFSSSSF